MKLGFADAVRQLGDDWLWGMKQTFALHVATELAMKDRAHDHAEKAIMDLCTKSASRDFFRRGMSATFPELDLYEPIEIEFVYPPIPERCFDYRATREGYEPGDKMGYGRTPFEAINDLIEQECEQ